MCLNVRYTGDYSIGTLVWATHAMMVKMAWICCKDHTCNEGAHCIWGMTLSHVTKVEKIKARLGLMDRLHAWRASWRLWSDGPRGGEAWARLGTDGRRQRWKVSEVKIDEPTRSHDDIKWIISFADQGWCMCCINIGGDRMECAKKGITYRVFHFIGLNWVEKCLTRFRIDGCTIKRGKLICISVI